MRVAPWPSVGDRRFAHAEVESLRSAAISTHLDIEHESKAAAVASQSAGNRTPSLLVKREPVSRAEGVRSFEDSQQVPLALFQKREWQTREVRAATRLSLPPNLCRWWLRAARLEEPPPVACCLGKAVRGTAGQSETRPCVRFDRQEAGLCHHSPSFAAPFPTDATGFPRRHSRRNCQALRPPTTTASRTQRTEPRTRLARGETAPFWKLVGIASR